MVRSTFLGASQPPRSEVKKNSFGTPQLSKGVTNHPLVVTPESPPRAEKEGGAGASTSTAATSSTDAHHSPQPQPQHTEISLMDIAANDQLSVMRDGPEVTIIKLRKMLDESSQRDATAKAALAKSDAVILELRSSVRQLKRELERVQNENASLQEQPSHESALLERAEERHASEIQSLRSQLEQKSSSDQSREEYVGELQVQLDRAHAQILTADMVRKELEDTLEAEQYTWELRVQDQDRTISSLQQECQTLKQDLTQCRSQWSEAEEGWSKQLTDLQKQLEETKRELNNAHSPADDVKQLKETVATLEQDRTELQNCLDEAMQELEAVDAEIQAAQVWQTERDELMEENQKLQGLISSGDAASAASSSVKPLQKLVRWLQERPVEEGDEKKAPEIGDDPESMVAFVREHIEALDLQLASAQVGSDLGDARDKVTQLEAQLSVYRGDLKAREESSAELRTSLKEAVALLKPLQEVVDKTEREKQELNQELERLQQAQEEGSENKDLKKELEETKKQLELKEEEIKRLKGDATALQKQLDEARKKIASAGVGKGIAAIAARSVQPSNEEGTENLRNIETNAKLVKAREDLRAKRASERVLKQMLKNAQDTFSKMNQENREAADENMYLQEKLSETEKRLNERSFDATVSEGSQATVDRLEEQVKEYSNQVKQKDEELTRVTQELQRLREEADLKETEERWDHAHRVEELEAELSKTKGDLKTRKEAERVLGSSLKEALGLLRPLQGHLETAEREKKKLERDLRSCQRRVTRLENGEGDTSRADTSSNVSRSFQLPPEGNKASEDLEKLVEQLEDENARLQDALEEISLNLSMSADEVAQLDSQSRNMLKENFVELKSRYEVTRQRLENANAQRANLAEQLKQKEQEEKQMAEEMEILREKLQTSNEELENAKYIATSALVKVEEMTMAAVEKEMVDFSAGGSQTGLQIVEKEIMDMSRKNPRHIGALSSETEDSEEVRNLKMKVESLENEVTKTKLANASLEQSVRERDRSLKKITVQRHQMRESLQTANPDWYGKMDNWGYSQVNGRRQLT